MLIYTHPKEVPVPWHYWGGITPFRSVVLRCAVVYSRYRYLHVHTRYPVLHHVAMGIPAVHMGYTTCCAVHATCCGSALHALGVYAYRIIYTV